MTTLGSLWTRSADDDEILSRLKSLAEEVLPEGWEQLPVAEDTSIFQQVGGDVLAQLVFALPTHDVVLAFDPSAKSLSEDDFLTMKQRMLQWPFCRGLILRPKAVALPIHGSAQAYDAFASALSPLRPLLLSRGDVDSVLRPETPPQPPNPAPAGASEDRLLRIEDALERLFADREDPRLTLDDDSDGVSDHSFRPDRDNFSDVVPSEHSEWQAPPLLRSSPAGDPFSFTPNTEEQAPAIPDPAADVLAQAIHCQRLGTSSWNRVRYSDVLQRLQAGAVFLPLQVNPQLPSASSQGAYVDHLRRTDATLGTLTHGLLLQRKAFESTARDFLGRHPELKDEFSAAFSESKTPFRQTSDDVLQFTCGKRAEVFAARRTLHLPADHASAALLQAIPPSASHLFEEKQFADFSRQRSTAAPPAQRSGSRRDFGPPRPSTSKSRRPAPASTFTHPYRSQPRPGGRRDASSTRKASAPNASQDRFRPRSFASSRPSGRSARRF